MIFKWVPPVKLNRNTEKEKCYSLEENWLEPKRAALSSVVRVAVNVFAEPPVISAVSRHPVKIEKKKQAISFARALLLTRLFIKHVAYFYLTTVDQQNRFVFYHLSCFFHLLLLLEKME